MTGKTESPRLFSYIVDTDTGLAPNPYWGYCTLACCKPQIRSRAEVGDTVVGLSSVRFGHRIIYAVQVTEILGFGQYFVDKRFQAKIPSLVSPIAAQSVGTISIKKLKMVLFSFFPDIVFRTDGKIPITKPRIFTAVKEF